MTATDIPPAPTHRHRKIINRTSSYLAVGLFLVLILCLLSLAIGSRVIPPANVVQTLLSPGTDTESVILWELRMPRTLAALMVGAALAVSGILMQALTRNPLAEPGLLGVNSGAAVAVVCGVAFLGVESTSASMLLAMLGAGLATAVVFAIGALGAQRGAGDIVRLVLAGVALSACLSAVTGIITMFYSRAFESYRFWVVGSVEGRDYAALAVAGPAICLGLVLAFTLIRPLNALALGQESALTLGVPLGLIRALAVLTIMLLCGTSTALAGPISFVGLVVPHVLRLLVGGSVNALLPLSLVGGPVLVLASDILGRVIAIPSEIEVGIVTAFLGAPVLLGLVLSIGSSSPRWKSNSQLATTRGGKSRGE